MQLNWIIDTVHLLPQGKSRWVILFTRWNCQITKPQVLLWTMALTLFLKKLIIQDYHNIVNVLLSSVTERLSSCRNRINTVYVLPPNNEFIISLNSILLCCISILFKCCHVSGPSQTLLPFEASDCFRSPSLSQNCMI